MKTIIFDKNALYWDEDADYIREFLRVRGNHLKNLLKCRGYLYLNQIHEKFGIWWDPSWENILYLADDGPIAFEFEPMENGDILIRIN